jgi:hypothetical protein
VLHFALPKYILLRARISSGLLSCNVSWINEHIWCVMRTRNCTVSDALRIWAQVLISQVHELVFTSVPAQHTAPVPLTGRVRPGLWSHASLLRLTGSRRTSCCAHWCVSLDGRVHLLL